MNKTIFHPFPVLETEKVILRQMLETDTDLVYDFNSSEEALTYIVREPFKTIEEAKVKTDLFLSGIREKTAFWWVFTLKETKEDIGYGGIFDISEAHNRAEIGYGLIKKYWNKGYMSEILKAILKFAVSEAEFHKIYGIVIPGNDASIRLLKKHNFKQEAHLKAHSFARDTYFDEIIYSLIID